MRDDSLIKTISADTHRITVDHTIERDDSNLCSTAADINDHTTRGLVHTQPCTDSCGHWLFNKPHITGTGAKRRLTNCSALNLCRHTRYADQHARAWPNKLALMDFGNEVLQHLLRHQKVGYHAIFQGANSGDVSGRSTQHSLGLSADRLDSFLAIVNSNRHHGGLVQHNPFISNVDQCVGGA